MRVQALDSKDIIPAADETIADVSPALRLFPSRTPLNLLNQEIEKLVTQKPYGDIYGVFALAAHLAGEAIAATTALQQDRSSEDFEPTLAFWHRLRDYSGTAALNCGGGNQTLSEALVTHQLLTKATGDVPNVE